MAIKIKRNEAGNCINFEGTSNPTYWNACLSGEVDSVETDTVNVINDVITADTGKIEYEFLIKIGVYSTHRPGIKKTVGSGCLPL